MKLLINIPEQMYLNAKADTLCGADILVSAIKNGTPFDEVLQEIRQEIEHLYKNNQQFDILTIINALSIIDKHIKEIEDEDK